MNPAGWHPDPYDSTIDRYWDGQQWTGETRPKDSGTAQSLSVTGAGDPVRSEMARRWPWILGAGVLTVGVLGFVIAGVIVDPDEKTNSVSVVSTTSSAMLTTSQAATSTTAPAVVSTVASTHEVVETTTEVYVPTTQVVPVHPLSTTQRSLEYSCSDGDWRDAMGAEGNALCGSTWTPRNQRQSTSQYTQHTPQATTTREQLPVGAVHPGSYCGSPGATGVTVNGTLMKCARGSDGEDRWQSAN